MNFYRRSKKLFLYFCCVLVMISQIAQAAFPNFTFQKPYFGVKGGYVFAKDDADLYVKLDNYPLLHLINNGVAANGPAYGLYAGTGVWNKKLYIGVDVDFLREFVTQEIKIDLPATENDDWASLKGGIRQTWSSKIGSNFIFGRNRPNPPL